MNKGMLALTICSSALGSGLRAISEFLHTSGSRVPTSSPFKKADTAEIFTLARIRIMVGSLRTSIRSAKSSTVLLVLLSYRNL